MLLSTSIFVPIRVDQQGRLLQRLEELKQEGEYLFPGTVARYILQSKTHPGNLEVLLIWRSSLMPDEVTRRQELDNFRQALADVLDWTNAKYDEGQALFHT